MHDQDQIDALVIGAGPAGLMAAEMLADAGRRVVVAEAKPSPARKLLMAGKSGLNLTKEEPQAAFLSQIATASPAIAEAIRAFDNRAVMGWARELGQGLFTGSTGRVFPKAMKASPLLRAWLARLQGKGIELRRNWYWQGWDGEALSFQTPEGPRRVAPGVTVLALGGASWPRLGSDAAWVPWLRAKGVAITDFQPSNAAVAVDWSPYMAAHMGAPLKAVTFKAGDVTSKGEVTLTRKGIEGGGIYPLSRPTREGATLTIDLLPDLSLDEVRVRLARPRGKATLSNHLRKALNLPAVKIALLNEFRIGDDLAANLKGLPIRHQGLRPIDEAISSAGGIAAEALTQKLMLKVLPGVFAAGEMLDWDAPTGGYLLTGCLATGRAAGMAAANYGRED